MPVSSATERATASASPVTMTTSTPRAWSSATACRDSGRIASSSRRAPTTSPSCSTWRMIAPWSRHASATDTSVRPASSSSLRAAHPDLAAGHRGGDADGGRRREAGRLGHRHPALAGCSHDGLGQGVLAVGLGGGGQREDGGLVEARRGRRPRSRSASGWPVVSVPVLSMSTTSTVRMLSSARRSFTSTPAAAARSVAMETTSGIARPRACGQAMTSTVMVRTTASSGLPATDHTRAVMAAAPRANQKSHAAARSAMRWARDDELWAAATRRWMPASAVSSPVAVTSTRRPESVATVPAVTRSPAVRGTVRDSPVTIDSSISARPSTMTPSAGTLPPGRTTTTSPSRRAVGRHGDDLAALDALGLVGQQCRERVERRGRLGQRAHLEPVPEQHDDDEQGELPPEVELVVEHAEGGAPRRDEGHADGEPDEEHHARAAGADLVDRSREERAAAPEIHHRAEHGRHPRRPRPGRAGSSRRSSRTSPEAATTGTARTSISQKSLRNIAAWSAPWPACPLMVAGVPATALVVGGGVVAALVPGVAGVCVMPLGCGWGQIRHRRVHDRRQQHTPMGYS